MNSTITQEPVNIGPRPTDLCAVPEGGGWLLMVSAVFAIAACFALRWLMKEDV